MQRGVVLALAEGAEKPFADKTRAAIGASIGESTPVAPRIQTALRALERANLVSSWEGRWQIDDPEFGAWVRENGPDAM